MSLTKVYLMFDAMHAFSPAYGKGAYFARDASYSDRYTDKACCMFRAKVIVGKYTEGNSAMQRPPNLPGKGFFFAINVVIFLCEVQVDVFLSFYI